MSVNTRQVVDALVHRYIGSDPSAPNKSTEELADLVRMLSSPQDYSLLDALAAADTGCIPAAGDIAVLHSVRDCMTMIFNLVDLDPAIRSEIHMLIPHMAADILLNPAGPLSEDDASLFIIADQLLEATVGWSSDLGRAGEQLLTRVKEVIAQVSAGNADYAALASEFRTYHEKDRSRITKLEDRLAASESGKLRSQRSRAIAAEMINESMAGQQLTANIVEFLQGPWFESMQLLALNKGLDGDDWIRATKLTETLIWTYQPVDAESEEKASAEKQRLYRIVENMGSEIRELLLAFEHNTDDLEAAISDIEQDHFLMVSEQPLDYEPFEPIESPDAGMGQRTSVSRILLKKVNNLEPGQWFLFSEADKNIRIKLVLKLPDVKQMLFTNRNGMKALDKTYDELAYLISSSVIKPLNHEAVFSSTFRTFYQGLIEELARKQKIAEEADREQAERDAAQKKAAQEAAALSRQKEEEEQARIAQERDERLERAKEEAAKAENQEEFTETVAVVSRLGVGAWVKLPAPDGTLEDCKLAVKIAAADKMIFVSRTGVKIGEYSTEQLTTLLVAGEAEISDTGVEFEDTLAQVVSKLRADREKSYDDLTGSE